MYSSAITSAGTTATKTASTGMSGAQVWLIISVVVAVIGGIALYFTFLSNKNEGKFKKFWGWTYEFLKFKKLFAENLLKLTYLILAIFVTLISFNFISVHFLIFILILILGNILLRLVYEFLLIKLIVCQNTTDINNKLSKNNNT